MRDDEDDGEEDSDVAGAALNACRNYDFPKILTPPVEPPEVTAPEPEAKTPRTARRGRARPQ